ncbi:UDP-N-acetylglucosamine transferase subunit [Lunasporangiospora selenospora]|uniref:UDP-N-acetylglucosamine transferase subunit ALG14 n=1 Tax=Lunasporangiospora selenospora TaxID=979761 RepID=A0A9P6G165_9FUNG|nr:UDP-N-acetylglucosamine transferase subunit [Lunasporangiospora selenospora]
MDDLVSIEKVHQLESARGQIDITHQFNIQGKKVVDQEQSEGYTIHRIPRSRFVHQSILTTPFTLIKSLLVAMPLIQRLTCYTRTPLTKSNSGKGATPFKTNGQSILLLNGPGTCFALALTVIGARMLGVPIDQTAAIVFVESFARVQTLSLTGKLLYPIADVFLVQWDELCQKYPRSNYLGMLV